MMAVQCAALAGLILVPAALASQSTPGATTTSASQVAVEGPVSPSVPWNRRTVEHLFNRAGFGAREGDIQWALRLGPEALVEELLRGGRHVPPPHYTQGTLEELDRGNDLPRKEKRRVKAEWSSNDRAQLATYASWWLDRMVRHDEPLRDRMTLLWHGLFATEHRKVKRSYDMIEQHQLLRQNALGNYGDLLRGIVADPAMLAYLDNTKNKKGNPNENLGRELLELFSLGEGNYSEADVGQVARALTGHSRDRLGNYLFNEKQHDRGSKSILGETSRFDADGVVDVLLEQTACARFVAGRVLTFLEGVPPDELRLVEYAAHLKLNDYELSPFLHKLLLDPRFYREEIIGVRVAGPIDYLVGNVRRLALDVDSEVIYDASAELGQHLFNPPSVKGWIEGEAWITTGSLLARGNTMGLMLGTVDLGQYFKVKGAAGRKAAKRDQLRADSDPKPPAAGNEDEAMADTPMSEEPMDESMADGSAMEDSGAMQEMSATPMMTSQPREISRLLESLGGGYEPTVNLIYPIRRRGVVGDERVVAAFLEDLLAIEPPADTRTRLASWLRLERERLKLSEEDFVTRPNLAEPVLRRLAHLILSLPESQLG
jgi:uncharacterized protein (DUF1800 family)